MFIRQLFILIISQFCLHLAVTAQGNDPPVAPFIKYVTVDTATNNTHIFWEESPSTNVEKYVIYEETSLGGIVIDSVNAPAEDYIHAGSSAGSASVLYSVAAVDSSGNISTREDYNKHSTVYISAEYDSCNSRMILKWNKYKGWDENISGYKLYKSRDFSSFELLKGLSYDTVYIDNGISEQGITENMNYQYYVVTLKNDGLESFSNITFKYTYMPGPPESLTAEYASVINKNIIELSFSFNDTSSINSYTLLRSANKNSDFQRIDNFYNINTTFLVTHDTITTGSDIFYYKLGALNSCNKVIKESNLSVNILLQGKYSENKVNLNWNPYVSFIHDIQEYDIYRKEKEGDFIQVGTNSSNDTEFVDDISIISGNQKPGIFIYKINAIENITGNTVFSNELIILTESDIYMPNAFTPDGDGINDLFKPVMNFVPEEFTMIIYDRNNIKVFQTNDPENGWDGTIKGARATEGVYIYYVEYKSYNGTRRALKPGTVTVFYPK